MSCLVFLSNVPRSLNALSETISDERDTGSLKSDSMPIEVLLEEYYMDRPSYSCVNSVLYY